MATTNKLFGLTGHLGKRSSWAGTFEGIFSSAPRDDCPENLAELPPYTEEQLRKQRALPLNDHMEIQVQFYCKFNNLGEDCGKDIKNQYDASVFIVEQAEIFMNNRRSAENDQIVDSGL